MQNAGIKKRLTSLLLFLLVGSGTLAAADERWLHIRVDKAGDDAAMVRVNVPLKMAEKVLTAMLPDGKVKLGDDPALRAVLEAVRTMEDAEYVTVDTVQGSVRVAKEKGYLIVEGVSVENSPRMPPMPKMIDIKIPFSIVETLVSTEGNELNVLAALQEFNSMEEVFIKAYDQSSLVSVWIDSESSSTK